MKNFHIIHCRASRASGCIQLLLCLEMLVIAPEQSVPVQQGVRKQNRCDSCSINSFICIWSKSSRAETGIFNTISFLIGMSWWLFILLLLWLLQYAPSAYITLSKDVLVTVVHQYFKNNMD